MAAAVRCLVVAPVGIVACVGGVVGVDVVVVVVAISVAALAVVVIIFLIQMLLILINARKYWIKLQMLEQQSS